MRDENRIKRLGKLLVVHKFIMPLGLIVIGILLPGGWYIFLLFLAFAWAWLYFIAGRIARKIIEEKQP